MPIVRMFLEAYDKDGRANFGLLPDAGFAVQARASYFFALLCLGLARFTLRCVALPRLASPCLPLPLLPSVSIALRCVELLRV